MSDHTAEQCDLLRTFLKFADEVQANAHAAARPAYAQTCPCGGTIELSRDVPAADRRRLANNFHGLHQQCTRVPGGAS